MCLGQCLETLRKNQARAASMIPMLNPISSLNPRAAAASSTKRRPSVVPFRHSKLTELFQPFFTGEGRTVMIVNANPYDTGFDENSHVMRFSAVAKEVQTLRGINETRSVSRIVRAPSTNLPFPTASGDGAGGGADITIVEESDDEDGDEDEDASGSDGESTAFVDLLIARHEELRERLYEAELRAAAMEQTVREEMAAEMAERLAEMEARYTQRLLSDVEQNEDFFNRKIDLLVSATSGATGARKAAKQEEQEVEESVGAEEESLVTANESTALTVDESTTSDNSVSLQPGPFEKVAKRGVAEEDSDVEEDESEEEEEEGAEEEDEEEEEESEEEESVEEEDGDSSYAAEESIDSPPPPPRRRSTLTTARKSNPLGPRTSVNVATTPKQRSASNLRPKGKSSTMSRLDESASDDDLLIPSPSKSSLAATPRASNASTSSASPRKRRTLRSGRAVDEEEIEARVARI